jgi:DNA-binding MarR family transcriptional regulator
MVAGIGLVVILERSLLHAGKLLSREILGPPYQRNPTELMRATLLSSAGVTKRLDRLAEAGLVERRPDPHDRRSTLVRLTGRGKQLVDRALPGHLANEERLLAALNPAERRRLDELLGKLLSALEVPKVGDRPKRPQIRWLATDA